jgi:hypothetical protein
MTDSPSRTKPIKVPPAMLLSKQEQQEMVLHEQKLLHDIGAFLLSTQNKSEQDC